MNLFTDFIRPAIFLFNPELAHKMAIMAFKTNLIKCKKIENAALESNIAGLNFKNPIGLAAGFDKNAIVADALFNLGFGAVEVGTLTPKPQAGNQKPRLFRLVKDEAVINRMGFNNQGHAAAYHHLAYRKKNNAKNNGILGVNIGANKDALDRVADYALGIKQFYDVADYFTVNISSPNTPGLRDLQEGDQLDVLIKVVSEARQEVQKKHNKYVPIFLKIAPDLTEKGLDAVALSLKKSDFDGVIVTNTTLSRTNLYEKDIAKEAGGLSGRPIFDRSTIVLAKMRQRLGKDMPIIGVGGVRDAITALEKIKAGADVIQLYSAIVYEGPFLVRKILQDLVGIMQKDGVAHISHYRDQTMQEWALKDIPE